MIDPSHYDCGIEPEEAAQAERASFMLGADQLRVWAHYGERRIRVSVSAPELHHRDIVWSNGRPAVVTVDPERPMRRLAADIQRRVVEASAEVLSGARCRPPN